MYRYVFGRLLYVVHMLAVTCMQLFVRSTNHYWLAYECQCVHCIHILICLLCMLVSTYM